MPPPTCALPVVRKARPRCPLGSLDQGPSWARSSKTQSRRPGAGTHTTGLSLSPKPSKASANPFAPRTRGRINRSSSLGCSVMSKRTTKSQSTGRSKLTWRSSRHSGCRRLGERSDHPVSTWPPGSLSSTRARSSTSRLPCDSTQSATVRPCSGSPWETTAETHGSALRASSSSRRLSRFGFS